jgi:hypothetical protein
LSNEGAVHNTDLRGIVIGSATFLPQMATAPQPENRDRCGAVEYLLWMQGGV